MLLEFEVPVMATAIPKRGKQPKLVLGLVKRTVDVPEYREVSAPVVLSGSLSDDWNVKGKRPIPREFRLIGDDLYLDLSKDGNEVIGMRPRGNRSEPRNVPFRQVAELIEAHTDRMTPSEKRFGIFPPEAARALSEGRLGALPEFDFLGATEIDQSMIDACLEKFDEEASKLAIVGGKIHKRERSPVIEVFHTCYNGTERMSVRTARRQTDGAFVRYNDSERVYTPLALFQIDQAAAAMEFAKSFGFEVLDWGLVDLVVKHGDIPIHFNGPSATIHALAIAMNDRIAKVASSKGDGRSFLRSLSPAVMRHFNYLEDTLPTVDEENVPDELATAIEDILVLPEAERSHFVADDDPGNGPRIWAALDLWEDRAVRLSVRPDILRPDR
ncbi:hypothetical protein O9X98_13755 [Agrobacterium salinitolerans]|nr:hypothetical protein [Agrobacterium salinitolerans]